MSGRLTVTSCSQRAGDRSMKIDQPQSMV